MIDHATYCEYRKAYDAGTRNNAHTGLIDQYEAINYKPPFIIAYAAKQSTSSALLQTWTGELIGVAWITSSWPVRSYFGSRMFQYHANINGAHYTGRGFGNGMSITLKRHY